MGTKGNCWQQDIRFEEYVKAFLRGIVCLVTAGYLFYSRWIALLLLPPAMFFYMRTWKEEQSRRKEQEFREQFCAAIEAMAGALSVGYSVENAIRETVKDIKLRFSKESRILREFGRMIHQLELNQPVEQVIQELSKRVEQEDVSNFADVFTMAKRTGGDSIAILRDTVKVIREKIEVDKEIQTLLSAKKLEFKIMCVVPFGILLYIRLAFPEFMQILYGNPLGVTLMSICLGVYGAAVCIGKRLVEIEV